MLKGKWIKKIVLVIIILLVLMIGALAIYARNPYTALEAMTDEINKITSEEVTVYEDGNEISFTVSNPIKNIVFIPGGLVTADSYSYLAYQLALAGYDVTIAKAPFHLAILNPFIGRGFIDEEIDNVVIGHSLGGVVGSMLASGNDLVDQVILLGSYPIQDLSDKDVLYISAEHDIMMNMEEFEGSFALVSEVNQIDIEGGNHAQFGWYGPQRGDGEAEMDTLSQQDLVIGYILDFINE
jgi:hypothetical protein